MYYVFHSAPSMWRSDEPDIEMMYPAINPLNYQPPSWWSTEALTKPLPVINYSVPSKAPLRDNYRAARYELYSKRLIDILYSAGVRFEEFPAQIMNRKTGALISPSYSHFHLLEKHLCINKEQSILRYQKGVEQFMSAHPSISLEMADILYGPQIRMQTVVMKREYLQNEWLMFRPAEVEYQNLTIIHEELKRLLESANITGCEYLPVEVS